LKGGLQHSYATLDALRGVAAIAVVLYHCKPLYSARFGFPSGYLAVDLFFVLSGFVITHAYEGRIRSGLPASNFIAVRLIRFWPMIALGVLLGAIQLLLLPSPSDQGLSTFDKLAGAAFNLAILPSFFGQNRRMFTTNAPEWSLFYELAINIAFARGLTALRGSWLVVALLLSALGLALASVHYGGLNVGWQRSQLPVGFLRVFFSFMTGVAIHRSQESWGRYLPKIPARFVLLAAALLLWFPAGPSLRPFYDIGFVLLLSPLLVAQGTRLQPQSSSRGAARWLADLSYPLYAIHHPVLKMVQAMVSRHPGLSIPLLLGFLTLLLVASPLLGRRLDAPIRKRLARWLGKSS
jgi:peptidoglycan/LPS O-acetylase OafA/YrhL